MTVETTTGREPKTEGWTIAVPLGLVVGVWYCYFAEAIHFAQICACALPFIAAVLWLHERVSDRLMLLVALGFGFATRFFLAMSDMHVLPENVISEDAYYYFNIARNIVAGEGSRHDSFEYTTGYQPLFMILLLPIFRLIAEEELAIRVVLILQAFIGLALGVVLSGIGHALADRRTGVLLVLFWSACPVLLEMDMNGQETGLALLALGLVTLVYLRGFRGPDLARPGQFLVFGLLLGTAFLCRMDLALLVPALLLHLVVSRPAIRSGRGLVRLSLMLLGAALVASPWLGFCLAQSGSPLPDSGQATRIISRAYGFRFLDRQPGWAAGPPTLRHIDMDAPPVEYYLETFRLAIEYIGFLTNDFLLLIPGLLLLLVVLLRRRQSFSASLREVSFLFLFLFLLLMSYSGTIFGQWFFARYLLPSILGYAVLLACCLPHLAMPRAALGVPYLSSTVKTVLLAMVLIPGLANSTGFIRKSCDPTQLSRGGFLEAAHWLNAHTPKDAVIGVFQSGIIGFHVKRRFVSLDGKVNPAARRALEQGTMARYAASVGVTHLLDWPWVLDDLFKQRAGDPRALEGATLIRLRTHHVYHLPVPPRVRRTAP